MWQKEFNLTPRKKRYPVESFCIRRKMLFQLSITVFFLLLIYFFILPDTRTTYTQVNNQNLFLYQNNVEMKRDFQNLKEKVLVTTNGYVPIPTDIMGEDNQMFFTQGGAGFPFFFMVIFFFFNLISFEIKLKI